MLAFGIVFFCMGIGFYLYLSNVAGIVVMVVSAGIIAFGAMIVGDRSREGGKELDQSDKPHS